VLTGAFYLEKQLRSFALCSNWSHTLFEKATAVRTLARDGVTTKGWVTRSILDLIQEAYKSAFHAYSAILDSFFMPIASSWIVFFLEHYIPQYYRWLTCCICARLCQCFGQGGCYFGCDKPCTCSSGGLRVGGCLGKVKKGALLMTSSQSVNREKTFSSSLWWVYAGHTSIRSWDYSMTDITKSVLMILFKTLKTLKVGKTKLATQRSWAIASWHHFSSFTVAVGVLLKTEYIPHYSCYKVCSPLATLFLRSFEVTL